MTYGTFMLFPRLGPAHSGPAGAAHRRSRLPESKKGYPASQRLCGLPGAVDGGVRPAAGLYSFRRGPGNHHLPAAGAGHLSPLRLLHDEGRPIRRCHRSGKGLVALDHPIGSLPAGRGALRSPGQLYQRTYGRPVFRRDVAHGAGAVEGNRPASRRFPAGGSRFGGNGHAPDHPRKNRQSHGNRPGGGHPHAAVFSVGGTGQPEAGPD